MKRAKKAFTRVVDQVINHSDIIVQVLDARLVDQTRNVSLEQQIESKGKRILFVINKSDLAPLNYLLAKKRELGTCVFVSSKDRQGISKLREYIYRVAARAKSEQITVGIIGYPNTGKSSIINALCGRNSASVSSRSGHTRGMQFLRMSQRVQLIDTPGVIPIDTQDEQTLALLNARNPDQLSTPDLIAAQILSTLMSQNSSDLIANRYGVQVTESSNPHELIETIAIKKKRLRKGGVPDVDTTARQIISDWQQGKLASTSSVTVLPDSINTINDDDKFDEKIDEKFNEPSDQKNDETSAQTSDEKNDKKVMKKVNNTSNE